jgi:hypothetical protein
MRALLVVDVDATIKIYFKRAPFYNALIRTCGRNLYQLFLIEIREANSDEPVNQQNQRKNGEDQVHGRAEEPQG